MNFRYENQKYKQGFTHIVGCDEVGRGSLAGPVAAAAVILDLNIVKISAKGGSAFGGKDLSEVRDSKLLSPKKREKLSAIIKNNCVVWGIGTVDEKTIDEINIHKATLLAMKRAVENLLSANSCELALGDVVQATRSESRTTGLPQREKQAGGLHYKDSHLLAIDGKFIIPSFAKATEGKPNFNIEQEAIIDGDNKILSIAAASIIAKVYRDDLMRQLHQQYPIYNFAQHKGYGTLYHRTMILQNGLSPIHRKSFCSALFPSLQGRG